MFVNRVEPIGEVGAIAVQFRHSIQSKRSYHREFRYVHLQFHPIDDALHEVRADHLSNARFKVAPGHVLVGLTRLQHRLLADHAVTLHLTS